MVARSRDGELVREEAPICKQLFHIQVRMCAMESCLAEAKKALDSAYKMLERGDFSEGYCCCGDSMDHHESPMYCGHSPVDMGEYYAGRAQEECQRVSANISYLLGKENNE